MTRRSNPLHYPVRRLIILPDIGGQGTILQLPPRTHLLFSTPALSLLINNANTFLRWNRCADAIDIDPNIVTTEKVFEEAIRQARTGWPLSASFVGHFAEYFCHRYTSRSVERYLGPWNVQPKNVVLVIGNQGESEFRVYEVEISIFLSFLMSLADPKTPFRNAQFVANLLGGKARLVQQAGYGYTSSESHIPCDQYNTDQIFKVAMSTFEPIRKSTF
jgi:hypothetical protein